MKVALVSFYLNTIINQDGLLIKDIEKDFSNFKNIILNPDYNLIIFPGWSLNKNKLADLKVFIELPENQEKLQNKLVIFEVYDNENEKYKDNEKFKDIIKKKDLIEKDEKNKEEDKKRLIYIIKNGDFKNTNIIQLFHDNKSSTPHNVEKLLQEMENNTNPQRIIDFMNKNILILVCGELFLLVNKKHKGIAFIKYEKLKERFEKIFNNIQLIVNIVHTPFTGRSKEPCYREYFSLNRHYFSTCNSLNKFTEYNLQHILKNKKEQILKEIKKTDYFLQTYDIE